MPTISLQRPRATRLRVFSGLFLIIATWTMPQALRAGDEPVASPGDAVLHLKNGGYLPGSLMPAAEPGLIRWQCSSFAVPLAFGTGGVNAVHFPVPSSLPRHEGDYCFELAGGDVLYGSLRGLDEKEAVLEIGRIGLIHVERTAITRMYRWNAS